MAKCRIQSIVPPCGYVADGLRKIWLLDFEDFGGFRFNNDDLYAECLVKAVYRTGEFKEVATPDIFAKYTSAFNAGLYTHSIETFIGELSAETLSNLNLATKRRQIVLFEAGNGKYFTFGYEAGAEVTYTNQTAENIGSVVSITAGSIYPLFEVLPGGMNQANGFEFLPDFTNGAYCETE